jgi:hypothetical protein
MADGAALATDVYLPPGPNPLPTVLVRLPYDKCGRYTFLPEIAAYLAAHGFAVVVQDVRGKFRSQGNLFPFANEAADGAATLDWITEQPWCSGAVGMLGDSYYGFTQWAAAATGHPALKAIVPRVTGCRFPGMFASSSMPRIPLFEWILHTFSESGMLEFPVASQGRSQVVLPEDLTALVRNMVTTLTELSDSGHYLTEFYPGGEPAPRLTIPALHMGGWWDNLQRAQLSDWESVGHSPASEHQYLRMNATDHEDFEWHEFDTPVDNHETDSDALTRYLPRLLTEPIAFLDHYLRDRPGRWSAPRVRYKVANGAWHVAAEWPPRDVEDVTMVLVGLEASTGRVPGGLLSSELMVEDSQVSWTHDPENPVPYLAESEWAVLADLPDEQAVHDRADVATFTSDVAAHWYEIAGPVEVSLRMSATSTSAHAVARLLDVYPDGRARVISEGGTVFSSDAALTDVVIDLGHTAYRVRAGHRLRLAISSSCFPLYAVHPGTDDDVWQPTRVERATMTLVSSRETPSGLRLRIRSNHP